MSELTDELKQYWFQILGYACIFFGSIFAWVREPGVGGILCGCAGVIDLIIVGKNQLVRRGWIKGNDIDTITTWTRRQLKYKWDLIWLGCWGVITTYVIGTNWGQLKGYEYVLFGSLLIIQLHLRLQKKGG